MILMLCIKLCCCNIQIKIMEFSKLLQFFNVYFSSSNEANWKWSVKILRRKRQKCKHGSLGIGVVCVFGAALTIFLVKPPQLYLVGFMLGLLLESAGSGTRREESRVTLWNEKPHSRILHTSPINVSATPRCEQLVNDQWRTILPNWLKSSLRLVLQPL